MMTNAYAANYHERTAAADYAHARQGDRRAARRRTTRNTRLRLRQLRKAE